MAMKRTTTTKRKKKTTGVKKTRKFYIKIPAEVKTAAEENKIKADARKKVKGVTFTKR